MLKPTPKERVLFVRKLWPALLVLVGVFSLTLVNFGRSPLVANAAAANTINFQARLQSNTGAIVPDGNYNIEFKIYDASSSSGASQGSCTGDVHCLWTETRTSTNKVQVINGYLSVNLGSVTAFSGINWDQQLWMTMNIGGTSSPSWDGEMSPRLTLTAVPYAFSAGQLNNTATGGRSTLSFQGSGSGHGDQNFVIQDQGAAGTYNLLTQNQNDARYIQLQGSTPGTAQTGNLNISGTGVFSTAVSTAQLTATGQTILGSGSDQTQLIVKANSSQSASQPLILLTASNGTSELARITSDTNGNFFAGFTTGGSTATGLVNTGVGGNALASLTTGGYNTAIGASALNAVNTGANNIGVGTSAGNHMTDAQGSIAIGNTALTTNVHGWNSIGIGTGADVATDSLNEATAIGAHAQVSQDFSMVLGCVAGTNSCANTTKIGIGNTAPSALFSVGSSSQFQVDINGNFKSTGGTALIKTSDTAAFQIQNSSADNILNVDSTNRKITIGDATNGGVIVNYGATLNAAKALSNFTSNGAIGTAAATVDTHTGFTINQTTSSISLTIPSPTDTTAGRLIYIANIGSVSVTVGGTALAAGNNATFLWNGSAWANASASGGGGGGSFVTLQGSTPGTADTGNLNITGTGVFGTAVSTAQLTVTGNLTQSSGTISLTGNGASQVSTTSGALTVDAATNVNVGTTNATGVTLGNTSNTSALLLQGTAGATYTIGTSGNTGGITLGNSTASNTIAIGNAATGAGNTQTINIGTGSTSTGKDVVTIGSKNDASSTTLQSGTGGISLLTNGGSSSTTGTVVKSDTNNSTAAFQVQNASSASVFAVNTATAGVTVTGNISQSTGTVSLTGNGASQVSTTSGALTLDAATTVNVGTTNATGVTVGNTSNTTAFLVQGTAGATYTIGTSGNTGGITVGNSTDTNTIAIGNAATATSKIQTINIGAGTPAGTGKAVVTIGNQSNASSVTLQSGTGSINLQTNGGSSSTTGTVVKSVTNNSTAAFQVQNSSSLALFNADTSTGTITIGSSAGSGSIFLNNGATVNSTLALSDFATGGSIGSAATTVDIYTSISVNQTTASQTLTLPNPTASTTYGRLLYLSNIGSTNFTVGGFILKNGASATFVWSNTNGGASWQYAGADGASILNQSSSDQTADFRISGTGRANTKFTSPLFDSITGALSLGTSTATGVTIGGTTNTATLLLQGSTAATYTFGTSDNTGGMTIGNSTDTNTIAIGNAATATGKIQTINMGAGTPAGTGKAVITIGNQSNASSVTLQSGTGNISLFTNGGSSSTTGTVVKSVTNNSTAAFQVQNASAASAFNIDTTNNKVTIGTSDTTGTVLVLDTKTDFTAAQTSDPTGVAGGMYYNSATGSFRCYDVDHWRDCLVSARTGYHKTFELGGAAVIENDFEAFSENSAGYTIPKGETGHPGITQFNTNTSATAYYYGGSLSDQTLLLGNNDYWREEAEVRLPSTFSALSSATQRYIVLSGFIRQLDTYSSGAPTDGCYFKYSDNVNSGKWQGTCASNTTTSTCDTGTTVAMDTWYRLTVVVNAAGTSTDFRINGVSKCTITTNIPTGSGRQTGFGVSLQKTVGTTDRDLDIDYIDIEGQFGTPR